MDREQVIKGLEICIRVQDNEICPDDCPYRKDICYGTAGLMADALALLKEQEAVKPCVAVDTWICPKCGHALESQYLIDDKENPHVLVHEQYNFCPNCGKAVKWE